MSMICKGYAFVVTMLLLKGGLQAQPATYFPHHLGDIWEYFVLDGAGNDTLQVKVISDSSAPSGNSYVKQHRQLLNPTRPPWFGWYDDFILDTLHQVYGRKSAQEAYNLLYKLNANLNEWWVVGPQSESNDYQKVGFQIAKVTSVFEDTVFGIPTRFKDIEFFNTSDTSDTTVWLSLYVDRLAENFGVIRRGGGELPYNLYLRGCVINGISYGDTILVTVSEPTRSDRIEKFTLYQNYPNPFNPQTRIYFDLAQLATVSLVISDLLGTEVMRLINNQACSAGTNEIIWNGTSQNGLSVATGIYFLTLKVEGASVTKRMMLLR